MGLHVMVDLETMGTGNDAAIISLGAVKFDPMTEEIGDKFYVRVSLESSKAHGLTLDASTIMWWMHPDRAAAREALIVDEDHDLATALEGFSMWYGTDTLPVWGNGATFDNVILRAAFRACNMETPWPFWADRCYRTLKSLAPDIQLERRGTHHNALDDAETQAAHMQHIVQHLRELGALKL